MKREREKERDKIRRWEARKGRKSRWWGGGREICRHTYE
jgi:hypothetical protein